MSLGLIEGEHLVFKALYFPTNTTRATTYVRLGEGITGWVALHGEPQVVADVTKDPRYVVWEENSRSEMAVPIKLRGVVIGVLNVENMKPNAFSDSDIELIQPVADQLAIIIENGVLYDRIRRRQRYLETLRRVSQRAAPERDPNRFLQAITDALADEFDFPMVAILLGDDEKRELRLVAHSGEGFSRLSLNDPTSIRQSYDKGILGHVILSNRLYMASDTSQDNLYQPFGDLLPPGSQIAAPIRQHEKTVAVLSVETFRTNQFDEIDAQAITELANDLGISLENVTLNQRVATHAADMEQRVTERTAELLAAKERLEDLDKLKSKFMADVSHGLRTPITNLGLYMDLLSQRPDDPERVKQYVETIRDQTARLTEIVEDVLSLSRLESSREELDFRPVDLNHIVTSAVKVFAPRAERNGLTLSAVPADVLPAVLGEPQQIRQMITNLVENAILYTRDGDIKLTTAYDGQSGKVRLCVIDTGMGIEQDELEHIFDRFYRGKKIGESDIRGSGLGLAIVKEIVDLHEGTISVESTHGEGTTFTILLAAYIDTSSA
jgi:signal transduction histidine kinase